MQLQLLKYCDKCFLSLSNNLLDVGEGCTVELVHQLRLSIKRLHSLLKIIDYNDSLELEPKIIKIIDRIFLNAGNLRDIQIHISLLKSYWNQVGEEVNNFTHQLKKEKKKEERKFKKSIKQVNPFDFVLLNQRVDEAIEKLNDSILENTCKVKADELFVKIINSAKEIKDDNTLHRIRIMLKELVYTLAIIKKKRRNYKYSKLFISNLDSLQQKLGDWHDLKKLSERISTIDSFSGSNYLLQVIGADMKTIQDGIIDDLTKLQPI